VGTADVRDQLQAALGTTYSLERELGRGGMATVYLAQDTKHHRAVALKVLDADLAASLGPERFRREITLAAGLQYPHILSVYDSGESPSGQLWFTMMYVDGESLRDRIRREHQLALEEAVRITREAALALQYAHEHGVMHRDIKPENLLLTKDGSTLVADFGIARALTTTGPGATLTETGVAVGTPQYMSPEQAAADRAIDSRTDVYSLGAVCYEMLAGEPPFTGPTAQAVVAKMMSGEPPSVRRSRPTVPAAVDAAIRKALAPVPADRFATAADFANGLTLALAASVAATTTGVPTAVPPPRVRGARAAVLTALAVAVIAGGTYTWRSTHANTGGNARAAGPVGLAVLPFDNAGDAANAYFADGITGEIRGKLSALPALRLIASTSSNQYRHTTKPAEQIGRELGVHYLLTGRVQWEQGANGTKRVRVSPELVEVRDGAAPETKWQQSYDTTLADVFDVQSAVATRVADQLGVVLSPPAHSQLEARPTHNLAAYDAYLRSVALDEVDPATLRRALHAAEQAVALDSEFAAAWAVVSTRHSWLYFNSIPTQADAEAARQAAERAVALAPSAPAGYFARGLYSSFIANDQAAARTAFETALRLDPSSSEATIGRAYAEATAGQWAASLGHYRQAAALDPRSGAAAAYLSRLLLSLHRYPEGRTAAERGLTFAPANVALIEFCAMSWLGDGDLAGARAALRDVSPTVDRGTLASNVANFYDLYWALDSADRALVLTLPPSAWDGDRGTWGLIRAELSWLAGDTVHARRYADSARVAFEAQLQATPDDNVRHLYHGLTLAYLGRREAAAQEGERGLALAKATGDQYINIPYARQVLARIYVAAGDHSNALAQLGALLAKPYYISAAWIRIDPTWAPLRTDPRFERLIAQPVDGALPAS
jgi:TolB-like protein/predicted Ser/Thr protein kinase